MAEMKNQKLVPIAVLLFATGCTTTEEQEDPDFSMRYEICREGYAGPLECPEMEIEAVIAVE